MNWIFGRIFCTRTVRQSCSFSSSMYNVYRVYSMCFMPCILYIPCVCVFVLNSNSSNVLVFACRINHNHPRKYTHNNRRFVLFTIQLGNIGILFIGISNQLRKTISLQHQNTLGFFIHSCRHISWFKNPLMIFSLALFLALGSHDNCVNGRIRRRERGRE